MLCAQVRDMTAERRKVAQAILRSRRGHFGHSR